MSQDDRIEKGVKKILNESGYYPLKLIQAEEFRRREAKKKKRRKGRQRKE